MGFFKNLFKGKFKKIGQNAVKNLSEGRLIKGAGPLDAIVNTVASPLTSKVQKLAGTLRGTGLVSTGGHKAIKLPNVDPVLKTQTVYDPAQKKNIEIIVGGTEQPEEPKKDNTMLYIALAVGAWLLMKKK